MTAPLPRPRGRRAPRYDGAENRRRVLEVALDVFSEVGYDAAGTRAIAAAAGIEQGHLAYYFPNKMALWRQVIETFAHEAATCVREQLAQCSEVDTLGTAQAVFPALLRQFSCNPRITRLMLQECSVTSSRSEWLVENFVREVWSLLMPLFIRLKEEGRLGGAAPEVAYFSFIGSALITFSNPGLVMQLANIDSTSPAWVDGAIRHILGPVLSFGSDSWNG